MDWTIVRVYNALKFCPECGNELEIHPETGWKACFLHGDFETAFIGDQTIIWKFTRNLIKRG